MREITSLNNKNQITKRIIQLPFEYPLSLADADLARLMLSHTSSHSTIMQLNASTGAYDKLNVITTN